MDIRRVPGTQLANDRTGEIIYTPPAGADHLRDLLTNWERFLHNETELVPLVRMAVGHYQFEATHPFTEGNERTGRVLNTLHLIQEGLLNLPILYLSRYIIAHRADYYSPPPTPPTPPAQHDAAGRSDPRFRLRAHSRSPFREATPEPEDSHPFPPP